MEPKLRIPSNGLVKQSIFPISYNFNYSHEIWFYQKNYENLKTMLNQD